jgi:acetyl-CoA C-acetyltransferase
MRTWRKMSLNGSACVVGVYEHPTRRADGISLAQLHADVAFGALADAGLSVQDVDGYFCASDAPSIGVFAMSMYLGLKPRYIESTETGGSSYLVLVHHAAMAIAAGRCNVALITMGDIMVAEGKTQVGLGGVDRRGDPEAPYNAPFQTPPVGGYAMVARRHMHEFGTTPEQLAWVRVAASHHAQHNPNALHRDLTTVEEVLASPLVADPLRRLDCCVVTDGGGAIVLARPEIARGLARPRVQIAGAGEALKYNDGGRRDITTSAGAVSAPRAFEEARCKPSDIRYASLYDSFTITVLIQLEDIGFCAKGDGGRFAADGNLIAGVGALPINTDGGGLCSNHPGNRGGMTKILEAVRQARGEAHPAVQIPNPDLVLAHGTGGAMAGEHGSATLILERV